MYFLSCQCWRIWDHSSQRLFSLSQMDVIILSIDWLFVYSLIFNDKHYRSRTSSTICKILSTNTVKVFLFVRTNFRGFYKMLWSMGSWIRGFKHYRHTINGKTCISMDFYCRALSEPRNQRKLESHDSNDFTVWEW